MSEATTRADIKTQIDTVSNVGTVHDYERWADEWPNFLSLFKTTIGGSDVIRGWTITCPSFTQQRLTLGGDTLAGTSSIWRTYTYKIRGYFGLDDSAATEKTAIAIVEDVVELFDARIDTDLDTEWNPPAELTVFEPRNFGGVLCHYAEITLTVDEITKR